MRTKDNAVLGEYVYEQLRDMILTRRIKCGEKILEKQIEEDLGVSRTPVREAVRRLANEGIVRLFPNRHAEVITFDEETVAELGLMRITMDCLAAQLAVQNGSNRDFSKLEQLAKQCEEAYRNHDISTQLLFDSAFHTRLVELSENQMLIDFQKTVSMRTLLLQTDMFERQADIVNNIEHHFAIIEALYERDTDKVLLAIQQHLCAFYRMDPAKLRTVVFPF